MGTPKPFIQIDKMAGIKGKFLGLLLGPILVDGILRNAKDTRVDTLEVKVYFKTVSLNGLYVR